MSEITEMQIHNNIIAMGLAPMCRVQPMDQPAQSFLLKRQRCHSECWHRTNSSIATHECKPHLKAIINIFCLSVLFNTVNDGTCASENVCTRLFS